MELRKDYILNRYVIVSQTRGNRPHQFDTIATQDVGNCVFCPGHENETPPEIMRIPDGKGSWKVRVIPNKFAAAESFGNPLIKTDNSYYTFSDAYGFHEVIIESPDHAHQLWDAPTENIVELLGIYKKRVIDLSKRPNIKSVTLFKNSGRDAGTSIVHTHTQIVANNIVSPQIEEELFAIKKYKTCPYCDILDREKNSLRRCFENNSFIAFTPYASRFHYEVWIFPKKHVCSFVQFSSEETSNLAEMMRLILQKLKSLNAPYNYLFHFSEDALYHFHVEFIPRLAIFAGFEYGSNITINSVSPEDAAKFYRGENE